MDITLRLLYEIAERPRISTERFQIVPCNFVFSRSKRTEASKFYENGQRLGIMKAHLHFLRQIVCLTPCGGSGILEIHNTLDV